jgi:hypothetical protein
MQGVDGWGSCIGTSVPTCLFPRRHVRVRGRIIFNAACLDAIEGSFFEGCRGFFNPNISFKGFFNTAAATCSAACVFSEA